jgi:hypothetical protein
MTDYLHEDRYTFFIVSRSVLLRMKNISDKSCRENQNTHFILCNVFRKSSHLWDRLEKYFRARRAINDYKKWCMRFACCISKATDSHLKCIIPIAYPRQEWLCESFKIPTVHYVLFRPGITGETILLQLLSGNLFWCFNVYTCL